MNSSIRIAFDCRPGTSGPARYVASLVRELSEPEWTISYIEREPECLLSDVNISVTSHGNMPATCAVGQRNLKRQAISLVPRPLKVLSGFCRDVRRRSTQIRSQPHDIIHIQNTGCEEMPIAARLAGSQRIIGTFHVDSTYDLGGIRSGLAYRGIEWFSNRSLQLAIAVSEATKKDWVKRTRISPHRVITIHNGIDPLQFSRKSSQAESRMRLGLPPEALIIGGMGRLAPAKGFEYLLEAASHLSEEFPRLMVALAGTGALRNSLETQAERLGISSRVAFLGFQDDVNIVLDACDIFAMPSLCEALGYALLEAMAHELPAVGAAVGGIPEVIEPGVTGFLSPPRDGIALAKTLRPLIESAELRERMGRAGRARVVKHFHEADMVRKTLEVYRQMLKMEKER
jgi:glycosyltransferase involved in cell wall biosynthesis